MNIKKELLEQIEEWRKQQDMIKEMIEAAYNRIDIIDEQGINVA